MPDGFDVRTTFRAAEVAAASGDLATAEVCLREALRLQSTELGADDPRLAPTLNNLAVVCERVGKLTDAEGFYRRAYAVAKAGHDAFDPLVVTSRDNLQAFLEAYHLPALDAAPAAWASATMPSLPPTSPPATARPGRGPSRGMRALAWTAAIGLTGITVSLWWPRPASAPQHATAALEPGGADSSPAAAAPAPMPQEPAAPAIEPLPVTPAPSATKSPAPVAPPAAAPAIDVKDARLCRDLTTTGGWTCTVPGDPVAPGRMYFLTRLDVARETRVVHAWLHEGRAVQTVSLTIRPSAGVGFRTYSRQTIDASRPGTWQVELRSSDGGVLATQQFVVQ